GALAEAEAGQRHLHPGEQGRQELAGQKGRGAVREQRPRGHAVRGQAHPGQGEGGQGAEGRQRVEHVRGPLRRDAVRGEAQRRAGLHVRRREAEEGLRRLPGRERAPRLPQRPHPDHPREGVTHSWRQTSRSAVWSWGRFAMGRLPARSWGSRTMSGHEDVERVAWEGAERLLAAALRGVRWFPRDDVIEAAQQIGLPVSLERVRGWRRLTDRQLFDRTFEGAPAYRGRLLVWNPYVGYSSTPAVIHASQL